MSPPFWLNDPTILLDKSSISEIWPNSKMCNTEKINAITRLIIILTVLGFLLTRSCKIIISGIITLAVLAMIYKKNALCDFKKQIKEPFVDSRNLKTLDKEFTVPTNSNPVMNVMLPEINGNPNRSAAAPAFNPVVEKGINKNTQEQVIKNNDLDSRLFKDLGDKMDFDFSMRNFYTTASSTIPNDQDAFAKWCYGDMPSCKDSDGLQCIKDNARIGQVFN